MSGIVVMKHNIFCKTLPQRQWKNIHVKFFPKYVCVCVCACTCAPTNIRPSFPTDVQYTNQ